MALMVIDDKILDYQVDNAKDAMRRIVGQIFRLLPTREEGKDWIKPLDTLVIELTGLVLLLPQDTDLYMLINKLQGLKKTGESMEFMLFRRSVFEACNIANRIQEQL